MSEIVSSHPSIIKRVALKCVEINSVFSLLNGISFVFYFYEARIRSLHDDDTKSIEFRKTLAVDGTLDAILQLCSCRYSSQYVAEIILHIAAQVADADPETACPIIAKKRMVCVGPPTDPYTGKTASPMDILIHLKTSTGPNVLYELSILLRSFAFAGDKDSYKIAHNKVVFDTHIMFLYGKSGISMFPSTCFYNYPLLCPVLLVLVCSLQRYSLSL